MSTISTLFSLRFPGGESRVPLGKFCYIFYFFSCISHLLTLFCFMIWEIYLTLAILLMNYFILAIIFNLLYSLSFFTTSYSQFVAAAFYQIFLNNTDQISLKYNLFSELCLFLLGSFSPTPTICLCWPSSSISMLSSFVR